MNIGTIIGGVYKDYYRDPLPHSPLSTSRLWDICGPFLAHLWGFEAALLSSPAEVSTGKCHPSASYTPPYKLQPYLTAADRLTQSLDGSLSVLTV